MNSHPTSEPGPRATVYTTLGQTLRVPLTAGGAPENQLIGWFNRQMAANPAFPVRVRSILLVTGGAAHPAGQATLTRFLGRWNLARRLRVVSGRTARPAPLSGELETATTIIHPNIDVAAQRTLLRMLNSQDGFLRDAATRLLADVRSGKLRGVYQEDQQVPALRARRQGIGWWQIVTPGFDAVRFNDPVESPLIVFRRAIRNDNVRMEEALMAAYWYPLATLPRGVYGRPL